jgi:midasin
VLLDRTVALQAACPGVLQSACQRSRVLDGRQGFITLRDLFRWAQRQAIGYDQLARNGYMLLAERVRSEDKKAFVRECLESSVFKTTSTRTR